MVSALSQHRLLPTAHQLTDPFRSILCPCPFVHSVVIAETDLFAKISSDNGRAELKLELAHIDGPKINGVSIETPPSALSCPPPPPIPSRTIVVMLRVLSHLKGSFF